MRVLRADVLGLVCTVMVLVACGTTRADDPCSSCLAAADPVFIQKDQRYPEIVAAARSLRRRMREAEMEAAEKEGGSARDQTRAVPEGNDEAPHHMAEAADAEGESVGVSPDAKAKELP